MDDRYLAASEAAKGHEIGWPVNGMEPDSGPEHRAVSAVLSLKEAQMAEMQHNILARLVQNHMEVLGADGEHVGTVDHLEGGDFIKLTKSDPAAGGKHHFIPMEWVDHVDKHAHLSLKSDQAKKEWQDAA
jgi:hypothetical protein